MTKDTKSGWRVVLSWCLYDFANSPFTTLIVTFVYAAYFTNKIVGDTNTGTVLWSRGVTITAISVALLSPFLGAIADRSGFRKLFLLLSTGICIAATTGLYFVTPGHAITALALFVTGNIMYEMGCVFYNAFLPDITSAKDIGRVSGFGWGLGYVGGLLALVVALVGFVMPEKPWFGFVNNEDENIRATALLVAVWFTVFCLPIFLWVKEDRSRVQVGAKNIFSSSLHQLTQTYNEIRHYRQIVRLLLARLFYNDGIVTIFVFAGIYAKGTFGLSDKELILMAIFINLAAGLGAFAMGYLDDVLGGKRTIQISLVGLLIASSMATLAPNTTVLWIAGILAGIFSGPNQSASRSLMGRFVPAEKENEFFGFFAFSGKVTAFIGPFFFGVLTGWFNQRVGTVIVLFLLLLGAWILRFVDEEEGMKVAQGTGSISIP